MKRLLSSLIAVFIVGVLLTIPSPLFAAGQIKIKALYIPLADHYAAIVAYEKYRNVMKHADYEIIQMKSWPALRGKFEAGQADAAFIIAPYAMDMFKKRPNFKWISLLHRDGNAMAINDTLNERAKLMKYRTDRKPDKRVARASAEWKRDSGKASICAVPSLYATHTAVLYKYLRDHGETLDLGKSVNGTVVARAVAPPKSPAFLKNENSKGRAASFEQSLPWADVVETQGFGKVAWYSKDVVKWPNGHVECIAIATDDAIQNKREALKEVIYYIHKAGRDIDEARKQGGQALEDIARMINAKHITAHTTEAIMASLDWRLGVINYSNLNNDAKGLKQIMNLAVEAGMIKPIVIEAFGDGSFATEITRTQK